MRTELAANLTEREFQGVVVEYAHLRGWRVHHTRPARTEAGWRTPIQGDEGFPDLVLARRGEVIFAELKSQRGRLTQAQAGWGMALQNPGRLWHRWVVWQPSDWPEIYEALT